MPLPSCTVTARIFFSLSYPRMSMVFTESLPLLFTHLSTADFIWISETLIFIYCTSHLCPPLHVSDKQGYVAGGMVRVMLLLLNAGTGLALAFSGKGPLSFRASPLCEESRLGNLLPSAVLCAVLFVPTPFWRILAVSILLLIPLP